MSNNPTTEIGITRHDCDGDDERAAEIDIHAVLAGRRQIAAVWGTDDVRAVRPDLSEAQCWEVLQHIDRRHDAEHGITWLTLECAAESLFGAAPDADEE